MNSGRLVMLCRCLNKNGVWTFEQDMYEFHFPTPIIGSVIKIRSYAFIVDLH